MRRRSDPRARPFRTRPRDSLTNEEEDESATKIRARPARCGRTRERRRARRFAPCTSRFERSSATPLCAIQSSISTRFSISTRPISGEQAARDPAPTRLHGRARRPSDDAQGLSPAGKQTPGGSLRPLSGLFWRRTSTTLKSLILLQAAQRKSVPSPMKLESTGKVCAS